MIATAARLSGYSATRAAIRQYGHYENNAVRLIKDTAGWAVSFGIFMGWSPAISFMYGHGRDETL